MHSTYHPNSSTEGNGQVQPSNPFFTQQHYQQLQELVSLLHNTHLNLRNSRMPLTDLHTLQGPSLKRQLALCNMIDGLYFVDNSLSPSTKLLDCLSSFTWLNSASSVNKVSKSTSSVSTMNSMNITACNTDCSMNKTIALWHSRLGHIPFSKMLKLSGISLLSSNKQSFICHVCPMARQQRLSFPSSTQVF